MFTPYDGLIPTKDYTIAVSTVARYPYTDDLSTSEVKQVSAQLKSLSQVPFEITERTPTSLTIFYKSIPGASAYVLEGFDFEGTELVFQRIDLNTVEFVNLIPGTQYKFKLAGVVGNEKGPISEFSSSTIPDVVKNFVVREVTLSSVSIYFQKGNGIVLNYKIEILSKNETVQQIETAADSVEYNFTIDSLYPDTEYEIQVTGHTPTLKGQTSRIEFKTKALTKLEQVVTDIDDFEINFKWFSDAGSFRIRALEVDSVTKSEIDNFSDFVARNSRKPRTIDNLLGFELNTDNQNKLDFNSSNLVEEFESSGPETSFSFKNLQSANLYAFEISRKIEQSYFPIYVGIESTDINPPQDVKLSKLGTSQNVQFLVQFSSPENNKNIDSYKIVLKSAESGAKLQQKRIAHAFNVLSYSYIFKDGELSNEVTAEVSAEAFGRASNAVNASFEITDGISLVKGGSDSLLLNWPIQEGKLYKIRYASINQPESEVEVNSEGFLPILPFRLENLKANTEYKITVLENDIIISEAAFLTSPLLIQDIKLRKATESSVTVGWEENYNINEISGFVINVFEFKSNKLVESFTDLDKSATQYKIDGLKSGTQYSVQIQVKDANGDIGPPNQNYVGTKPEKIEEKELILETLKTDEGEGIVNIRWDRLKDHENVAFYEVELVDVETGVLLNSREVDAGQEDITYEGLLENSQGYQIELKPVLKLANGKMVKGKCNKNEEKKRLTKCLQKIHGSSITRRFYFHTIPLIPQDHSCFVAGIYDITYTLVSSALCSILYSSPILFFFSFHSRLKLHQKSSSFVRCCCMPFFLIAHAC